MAIAVFGGKIGYQGRHRNPVEIGASPGVAKHQGLSRISTGFRLNPTKLPTIARKHRVGMELDANMKKRQPTKVLASQNRFQCLRQVRISDGQYFKHIKRRNDGDRLHKLAFRKWSSSSSFPNLSWSSRGNVVYIIIVIHFYELFITHDISSLSYLRN